MKMRLQYEFKNGDIKYHNTSTIINICTLGFLVGTLSAMFGIGGGVIFSPIFITYYKINLLVTTFTIAFISLITSMSSLF